MQKIISIVLALALMFTLTACGQGQTNTTTTTTAATTTTESASDSSETPTSDASNSDKTMGQTLLEAFKEIMQQEKAHTALDVAAGLLAHDIIKFDGMAEAVGPGLLPGFNVEIKDFDEGATVAPMIGSIPFVGYVFKLEADTDVEAFMKKLQDNANPNWLVCVIADETIIEAVGNTVFFLMCRSSNN